MLVTFFCMLVTSQSVANIIICQNVMLVTDILCWRHDHQPGSTIFNTIFSVSVHKSRGAYIGYQHLYTPECWCLILDVGDVTCLVTPTSQTYHQHIWSPTSVTNIDVTTLLLSYFVVIATSYLDNVIEEDD